MEPIQNRKEFFWKHGYLPRVFVTPPRTLTPAFDAMLAQYGSERDHLAKVVKARAVPFIEELARNKNITRIVRTLIGPYEMYSISIFNKYPGTAFVDWHQDAPYWEGWKKRPREVVTAWYAVDDSFIENGCMQVLPGTHTALLAHEQSVREGNFLPQNLVVTGVDTSRAVPLILSSGEASFHHGLIVHGSAPNSSQMRRSGIAIRYISVSLRDKLRALKKKVVRLWK